MRQLRKTLQGDEDAACDYYSGLDLTCVHYLFTFTSSIGKLGTFSFQIYLKLCYE
jgi:hypothetical protein